VLVLAVRSVVDSHSSRAAAAVAAWEEKKVYHPVPSRSLVSPPPSLIVFLLSASLASISFE
jgi:hypothetical protein